MDVGESHYHNTKWLVIKRESPNKNSSGCLISCTYDWPSGKEAVSILPR